MSKITDLNEFKRRMEIKRWEEANDDISETFDYLRDYIYTRFHPSIAARIWPSILDILLDNVPHCLPNAPVRDQELNMFLQMLKKNSDEGLTNDELFNEFEVWVEEKDKKTNEVA